MCTVDTHWIKPLHTIHISEVSNRTTVFKTVNCTTTYAVRCKLNYFCYFQTTGGVQNVAVAAWFCGLSGDLSTEFGRYKLHHKKIISGQFWGVDKGSVFFGVTAYFPYASEVTARGLYGTTEIGIRVFSLLNQKEFVREMKGPALYGTGLCDTSWGHDKRQSWPMTAERCRLDTLNWVSVCHGLQTCTAVSLHAVSQIWTDDVHGSADLP